MLLVFNRTLVFSAEKSVAIIHEVRRNSHSIAPIFVENIGRLGKLKIIGLDQGFFKIICISYAYSGAFPSFHLILQPNDAFCCSGVAFPANKSFAALIISAPVTGISVFGRESSN